MEQPDQTNAQGMPQWFQDWLFNLNRGGIAFRDLIGEDKWLAWAPVRTGWTDVGGAPTVTARYRTVGKQCFLQIRIVAVTSVASVAGTSYTSLPIPAKGLAGDGSMQSETANITMGGCQIDVANSRLYVPTRTATNEIRLIAAWYEIA